MMSPSEGVAEHGDGAYGTDVVGRIGIGSLPLTAVQKHKSRSL
jgi:hypothetical protein